MVEPQLPKLMMYLAGCQRLQCATKLTALQDS
jgi:hypothetical protein